MIPGHSQKLTLHCATGPFGPRNMPLFCNQPCAEGNAYWNPLLGYSALLPDDGSAACNWLWMTRRVQIVQTYRTIVPFRGVLSAYL